MKITTKQQLREISNQINTKNQNIPCISTYNSKTRRNKNQKIEVLSNRMKYKNSINASNKNIGKASRRDLPVVYAKKLWAATTVSSSMILANQAGIEVFVTGGIGGVHRGAEDSMDISADLQECHCRLCGC